MDIIEGIRLVQEHSSRAFYSYSSPNLYQTRSSRINNFLQTFNEDLVPSEPELSDRISVPESVEGIAPSPVEKTGDHYILTVTAEIHPPLRPETDEETISSSLTSHISTQTLSSTGNGKQEMPSLSLRQSVRRSLGRKNCEPFNKTIGYIHDPGFVVMKQAKSGKIWLSDRPEDLLVIKEDGRITIPLAARKTYIKTYPQQIRSKMEKIYDKIFSKKDFKQKDIEWGTSSLDRRTTFKYCSSQKQMKPSRSANEVSVLYPK